MTVEIKITKENGTWTVRAGGAVLVESRNAVAFHEADFNPVIYFPREDVPMEFLDESGLRSSCPHKGDATYYSIVTKNSTIENAAWSYETPNPAAAGIKDYVAFYASDKVTIEKI